MKELFQKIWGVIWKKLVQKGWHILLVTVGFVYIWHYRFELYQLQTINIRNLIFLVWLIVLLLPLVSEMEFLGVKIKKEVENANKEVKETLTGLSNQLIELRIAISGNNSIQIGNSNLPSAEKIDEMKQLIKEMQINQTKSNSSDFEPLPDDKNVYLFKVRMNIEKLLLEIAEKEGEFSNGYDRRYSLSTLTRKLLLSEIISKMTADLIMEVLRIANRGVHGEIVSDEYVRFVQKAYPEIMGDLKQVLKVINNEREWS